MKKIANIICLILMIVLFPENMSAQSFNEYKRRVHSEFQQYKSDRDRDFKAYSDSINAAFAEYMRQAWPEYRSKSALLVPDSPKPPAPVIKPPESESLEESIPFDKVIPVPRPPEPPLPVMPLPDPAPHPTIPSEKTEFSFLFYGRQCRIPLEDKHRFSLSDVSENKVADVWKELSSDTYLPAISHCLAYRDKLHLCDWAYVSFLEKMTTAFFPADQVNEARLLQMFILTQSGYKVRIARTGNRLTLLLPSEDIIYQYPYLVINGINYYLLDSSAGQTLNVFDREFPKEQFFSLRIRELPDLPVSDTRIRHLQSSHDKEMAADIGINKNLLDFYNDYPLSNNWGIYADASMSEKAKAQLFPAIRNAIAGSNTQRETANILLHFVQTAFEYATDETQFGQERALFADETLFYPYSDCEDRAILFSVLVRELMDLDVVLLHYPGHLATAVCFNTDIPGDYLQIDGKRYIICDPTYINADVGDAMPEFKQTPANVIRLH